MTNSKQLLVLSGGGRKGIVKLTAMAGSAKGTCSLDFRPAGATLYLVGDDIAAVPLKDMTTTFDVPFLSGGEASCLVRSSSLTMFGGAMAHSDLIKKVDAHLKNFTSAPSAPDDGKSAPKADAPNKTASEDLRKNVPEHDMPEHSKPTDIPKNAEHDPPQNADDSAEGGDRKRASEEKGARSVMSDIMSERDRFDGNNFYLAVKPQLDEMFVCYPEEPLLTATVERSKWVRVDASDGAYAVGILFDGDEPAFICYAVPERVSCRRPPAEIEEMCVWLPVSSRDIKGYWVIYQSAKTGEIIK